MRTDQAVLEVLDVVIKLSIRNGAVGDLFQATVSQENTAAFLRKRCDMSWTYVFQ
jgi:hypothetical protein